MKSDPDLLLQLNLVIQSKCQELQRINMNFVMVLSELGGIMGIVMAVLALIASRY